VAPHPRAAARPRRGRLLRLYRDLLRHFGPQGWWPGRTPFEIAVGAILTQHTTWSQAARGVAALRARGLLTARALAAAPEAVIAAAIRPAGTYRLKARRLRDFTAWLLARFGGRFEGMRRAALGPLRRELLAVPGLGPETVDAILLYAADRPVFVADAYARRVLARHRLLAPGADYEARASSCRRTCRPIRRSSTSFTRCSSPSAKPTAGRSRSAPRAPSP